VKHEDSIRNLRFSLVPHADCCVGAARRNRAGGRDRRLLELRQSGGVLRLAVRFANIGTDTADFNAYEVSRIVRVDAKSKKKHLPIKDANRLWLAGSIGDDIDGGRVQIKIPARQSTMNVKVPHVFPFDNVTVTEGTGKIFASNTARTTRGGGVATVWRKTTLVSLTFQAPPDTVVRADLMLPQFLPFEAIPLEGLGGAGDVGVAAAGETSGLEGALKELHAKVTPAEIKPGGSDDPEGRAKNRCVEIVVRKAA
jgi:hypothetical protein